MKTLIAIVNCHNRLDYQQAVRDTWLPFLPSGTDYRFFLGPAERLSKSDEVFLDCDDSYQGLPSKVRGIMRWADEHEYEFVLKCDDDVILKPVRLASSGFQYHDFTGHRNDIREYPVPYGFCYWLSKRAMKLVACAELPRDNNDEVWVTDTLSKAGIVLHHDERYIMHTGRQEDFVPATSRSLRRPPRLPRDMKYMTPNEPLAYCMYLVWGGYRSVPDEKVIAEMHRVFNEVLR